MRPVGDGSKRTIDPFGMARLHRSVAQWLQRAAGSDSAFCGPAGR
jgi:hypothetical protein